MGSESGLDSLKPYFDGNDFAFWKIKMQCYLDSDTIDAWDCIEEEWKPPTKWINGKQVEIPRANWNEVHLHLFSSNLKAMHILRSSLCNDAYAEISSCSNAYGIWKSLNSIYGSNNCGVVDVCANIEERFSHQQEEYEAKVESSQCCTIIDNACLIALVDEEEEAQSRRDKSMEC